MRQVRWSPYSVAVLVSLVAALAATSSRADDDPWTSGRQWLTVRAGYAKSTVRHAGDGGAGYGFGYSRMLSKWKIYKWTLFKQFSFGAYVHHEVLGRFGGATEIEVPATVELVRHFQWNTALHPYFGVGGGPFYRKTYRTGNDLRDTSLGYYLTFGANAPIDDRHVLGFDIRFIQVGANNIPENPVFGLGTAKVDIRDGVPVYSRHTGTHWSAKISYSLVQ